MDYSAANTALWNIVVQFGIIAAAILFANILRRKIPFFRKSLMPTAVLAGFVLLILRSVGILRLDLAMLEMITYHGIAIGFIAMTLRVQKKDGSDRSGALTGAKSGALIVATYLVQAIVGMVLCAILSWTVMPTLFKAAGVLLPMGYGQVPVRPTTSAAPMRPSASSADAASVCPSPPAAISSPASSASSC